MAISSETTPPVTFDTTPRRGLLNSSLPHTFANSASIGSISTEWNACETFNHLVFRPSVSKCSTAHRTSSAAPETTTDSRPFTAAIAAVPVNSGLTSASPACTATIAPPSGNACISRPRATTRRAASSTDKIPATHAAVISPTECPIT
nr:hypothetical protein [Rhodococcus sp. MTM3W5.2]